MNDYQKVKRDVLDWLAAGQDPEQWRKITRKYRYHCDISPVIVLINIKKERQEI